MILLFFAAFMKHFLDYYLPLELRAKFRRAATKFKIFLSGIINDNRLFPGFKTLATWRSKMS